MVVKARGWDGWYAYMDVGPFRDPSYPDFSTAHKKREEAIKLCAQKIRADADGTGKNAPHLAWNGYDFLHEISFWWDYKEREISEGRHDLRGQM